MSKHPKVQHHEDHEARSRAQIAQASAGLIDSANASHEEFLAVGRVMCGNILRAANAARQTGLYLLALRGQVKHGEWGKLFATSRGKRNETRVSRLTFDERTGSRYMSIARVHPDEIVDVPPVVSSLKDILIVIGVLPEPERGQQNPSLYGPDSAAQKRLQNVWEILEKEIEKAPVREWPEERIEHWLPKFERFEKLAQEGRAALRRQKAA